MAGDRDAVPGVDDDGNPGDGGDLGIVEVILGCDATCGELAVITDQGYLLGEAAPLEWTP